MPPVHCTARFERGSGRHVAFRHRASQSRCAWRPIQAALPPIDLAVIPLNQATTGRTTRPNDRQECSEGTLATPIALARLSMLVRQDSLAALLVSPCGVFPRQYLLDLAGYGYSVVWLGTFEPSDVDSDQHHRQHYTKAKPTTVFCLQRFFLNQKGRVVHEPLPLFSIWVKFPKLPSDHARCTDKTPFGRSGLKV